ncbi:MAG TPA: hypothetical protein VLJ39_06905 [Tepidisphaeraceae bacterium]|nr:hypothetical protein [Tepidisphaeraceae bacterium]
MRRFQLLKRSQSSAATLLLVLATLLPFGSAARADEKMAEVGSASVRSLNELAALAKSIGVELPPFLTAQGIEQQFAFFGQNGLDPDKPIGILMFSRSGWNIEQGQGVVFVLPAKPDAAPLSTFVNAGGKPVEGHADAVTLNGVVFRRTADDLIFSPSGDAALAADPAKLAAQFKANPIGPDKGPIARLVVDVDAMRTVQPEQFKVFIDNIRQSSPAKDDAERLGQNLVVNFVEHLNRLDLTLGQHEKNVVVKLAVAPANVPAPGQFSKPGMPSDTVARVDIAASPLKLVPTLDTFLQQFARAIPLQDGKPGDAEQSRQVATFLREAADTLLGGQAVSLGVTSAGKQNVVYLVEQQPLPDLEGRIKKFVDDFNSLSEKLDKPGERSSIARESYSEEGGVPVWRLKLLNKDAPQGYIDIAQKGSNAYISISEDAEHHLAAVMNLAPAGEMRGLARGEVKLDQAFAAAKASPDSGLSKMPADRLQALEDMVKGRLVHFAADGQADAIVFTVALPEDLVKQLVEMIQPNGGGPK